MKPKKEDPKVGILLVIMSPFIVVHELIYGSKHSKALIEGLSVLAAGTLILVSYPITKVGFTIRKVFQET